jgi:hypothetical protein
MADYPYYAEVGFADGSAALLDLEEHGWANKEMLALATRWSLFPKEGGLVTMNGTPWPIVVTAIPEGARPVFKARTFGSFGVGEDGEQNSTAKFRCYAIGWKKGKENRLVWVLPTGDIEFGEDPTMADLILAGMKS